jgi:plastocyanin
MNLDSRMAALGKAALAILLSTAVIPAIPRAIAVTNDPMSRTFYEVTGHVQVFHPDAPQTALDRSGVVVWLGSTQSWREHRLSTDPPHYRIMQIHKIFQPHLLVIPAGSIVEFPNYDPYFHNVFSFSKNRRFDLGLYEAGVLKAVKFDRPGISYLFCSIHPEMMAIVITVDSKYFAISDKAGRISIANVAPGQYLLNVWHQNAAPQTLQALRRPILVSADSRTLPAVSIALSNTIVSDPQELEIRSSPSAKAPLGDYQ